MVPPLCDPEFPCLLPNFSRQPGMPLVKLQGQCGEPEVCAPNSHQGHFRETKAACSLFMAWSRPFTQLSRWATNQPFCYMLRILNVPRPHWIPARDGVTKTHRDTLPETPHAPDTPKCLCMLCVFLEPKCVMLLQTTAVFCQNLSALFYRR